MKIARLQLPNKEIVYAIAHEKGDASDGFTRTQGDIYGGLIDTGQVVTGKLLAPFEPTNILCIGLNYKKHAEEGRFDLPKHPILFMKMTSTLQNPEDSIELPRNCNSDKVDFEAELAVVIGKPCLNASRDEALDYVLGYTCANDVSARDWQKHGGGGQWCRGKTFSTFCPLGSVLVTADEIKDPNSLPIRSILNGEIMRIGIQTI